MKKQNSVKVSGLFRPVSGGKPERFIDVSARLGVDMRYGTTYTIKGKKYIKLS